MSLLSGMLMMVLYGVLLRIPLYGIRRPTLAKTAVASAGLILAYFTLGAVTLLPVRLDRSARMGRVLVLGMLAMCVVGAIGCVRVVASHARQCASVSVACDSCNGTHDRRASSMSMEMCGVGAAFAIGVLLWFVV